MGSDCISSCSLLIVLLWYILIGVGEEILMFKMSSMYPHFPSIRHESTYGHPISTFTGILMTRLILC